jgi:tyrosyl-tRNA synthetase
VWLDPARTSPYAFYQYFVQVDDRDLERFLLQLTLLHPDEARAVAAEHAADPGRRTGQRRLAAEVTALVHGAEQAEAARAASAVLFGADASGLDEAGYRMLAGEIPTSAVDPVGQHLVELLAGTDLVRSKSDARRAIEAGELWVNGEKAATDRVLGPGDLRLERFVLLRRGRKRHHLLVRSPG